MPGIQNRKEEAMARTSPTSKAGVKKARKSATNVGKAVTRALAIHADDDVDGCDCNFLDSEPTPDEALPASKGGVEGDGGKGRRGSRQRPSIR